MAMNTYMYCILNTLIECVIMHYEKKLFLTVRVIYVYTSMHAHVTIPVR